MKLSETVEWSLHACVTLGLLPPGGALPAKKLSEYHDLPKAYLAKALQQLALAGVLISLDGRSGGYRLGRAAGQITVFDIVEAVEPRSRLFVCKEIRQRGPCATESCEYTNRCNIARVMDQAEEAWRAVLRETTLQQLLDQTLKDAPDKAREKSLTWFDEKVNFRAEK
tara:strand:+ start:44097 stop:44600 length:504 start_codon:yes stop_codon:yes gene_type:complete